MSADVFARVDAFVEKAQTSYFKGRLLSAAENFGRAAEAARALGADNLLTAHMQMRQGGALSSFSLATPGLPAATDDPRLGAARAEFFALLSEAMETLERRRAAGTLLEGGCTAAEEAWRAGEFLRLDARMTAAQAASRAALFGYEEYLRAAKFASTVLCMLPLFAAVVTSENLLSFTYNVVLAAELMQQPRGHADVALPDESKFITALSSIPDGFAVKLPPILEQMMTGAWTRLQRSGVLQARGIVQHSMTPTPLHQAHQFLVQRSMHSPDLRSCALCGCGAKEAHAAHFKRCAACSTVVYCCREHQVEGWPSHKKACKAARKAAAGDGAGPSGA